MIQLRKYYKLFYVLTSLIVAGVFFTFPNRIQKTDPQQAVIERKDLFANIELEAESAYVYDFLTGETLFAKNEDKVMPLASLTKIMTAVTALEYAPHGTMVTISQNDLSKEGDSGLYNDETWSLKNLLKFTLLVSSNDGAAAVASALGGGSFIDSMNKKAETLGLSTMRFLNESGLDESSDTAGGYGTAEDVAKLLNYAASKHQDVFETTQYASAHFISENDITHSGTNTDIIAQKIPGLVAGKTGTSDLAGANLAVLFDAGLQHPVAVVVLGSSYNGRFQDVENLVNAAIGTIGDSAYNTQQ